MPFSHMRREENGVVKCGQKDVLVVLTYCLETDSVHFGGANLNF